MSHISNDYGAFASWRAGATIALILAATACAGDGSPGGDSGGSSADAGAGGNVGFGGAQDIGQFRDVLERGEIPGEATLDAAGFFNEHFSEQPPPDCGGVLCAHGMLAVGTDWMTGAYQSVLQIGLSTPIDPATLERKPLDLVLVVDVSGSMSEDDRIGYVRQGLHLLVDQLTDGDRVALITYQSYAEVISPLAPVDRAALHARVSGLRAGGGTNIYDGLDRGFAQLAEPDFARQRRVMLLSDGLATAGITSDASIIGLAQDHIASGIGLTTVGVGDEFNVNLMRGLAERGAGNFYYLESPTAIAEVFGEELDYFVEPLALDVTLEVMSTKSYALGNVTGTRLWQTSGSTGSISLPAVFVASRTTDDPNPDPSQPPTGRRGAGGSLFVDMSPLYGADWGEDVNRVAAIRVTYTLPGDEVAQTAVVTVANPLAPGELPGNPDELYLSHEFMAEHYAMYNVFRGLRQATVQAATDYNCALATVERLIQRTTSWNLEAQDPDLDADLGLMQQFATNLRTRGARAAADPNSCAPPPGGYDDDYDDGYDDGYDDYPPGYYDSRPACSAAGGGGGGGLVLIGLAMLVTRRRRG